MIVEVRLAGPLRPSADGQAVARIELPDGAPTTLGDLLDRLERRHPGLAGRVRDERGAIRRHVNVFVGPEHARELGGLAAPVDGAVPVSILPAVSGGSCAAAAPVAALARHRLDGRVTGRRRSWPSCRCPRD
jgi:molybdopterin converting factor small subunit